jgi:transmembrane sensor
MNIDRRLKINAQISEEAAEWFVEFRTGDLEAAGRQAFDTWIRSSPEHLRAFLEVAAIWNEGGELDAQRELDIETLTARVRAEGNVVPLTENIATNSQAGLLIALAATSKSAPPRRLWHRYTVAASMLIALAAAALYGWDQLYREPTYATSLGEQRSITLSDGSRVELNSRSRLRVTFTHALRTVELEEGQALFQVTKNVARPFIVRSGATQVRAVGTQFDVNRTPTATIVTVLEGRVAVTEGVPRASQANTSSEGIYLAAGEQLSVSPQAASKPARANVTKATAWTHQRVLLDSATLGVAAAEFNRYSARKLTVEDTGATPLQLSGVFTTDPNFLIEYLRQRPDITIVETDTEIHIIRHVARSPAQ